MGIFAGEDIIVFMCSVRFRFTNHKRGKGGWDFFFFLGGMVGAHGWNVVQTTIPISSWASRLAGS